MRLLPCYDYRGLGHAASGRVVACAGVPNPGTHAVAHLHTAPIAVVASMHTIASCELVMTPATLSPLRTPASRIARAYLLVASEVFA